MTLYAYSHAVESTDLRWCDWRTLDIDWLTAAGMIGVGDPLPCLIGRLLGGEARSAVDILASLKRRLGRRYRLSDGRLDQIQAALSWWHDPRCLTCGGKGAMEVPGTPFLQDSACPDCDGICTRPHSYGRQELVYGAALRELFAAQYELVGALKDRMLDYA